MTQKSLIEMSFYEGMVNVLPLVAKYPEKLLMTVGLSIVYSKEEALYNM